MENKDKILYIVIGLLFTAVIYMGFMLQDQQNSIYKLHRDVHVLEQDMPSKDLLNKLSGDMDDTYYGLNVMVEELEVKFSNIEEALKFLAKTIDEDRDRLEDVITVHDENVNAYNKQINNLYKLLGY